MDSLNEPNPEPEPTKAIPENEPSHLEAKAGSNKWDWPVKLLVGMVLVGGAIALAIKFNNYLQLFLTALLISFLLQPVVRWITRYTKMKWKLVSAIVYLAVLALLVWGVFSGGRGLVAQITGLFKSLQDNVSTFTDFLAGISNKTVSLGPLEFTTPELNTSFISEKINEFIQPLIGGITKNAGKFLGSVGTFVFNLIITFLASFFITSESSGNKVPFIHIRNKDFNDDVRRMGREISGNFNAFLRGTFVVVSIAVVVYTALLGAFGVPYFFLLALIAGFGRFIPYVGAFIGWVSFGIGALIQRPTPFGLTPFAYLLVILGISLFIDLILDHIVTPSVMSEALDVHPAAIIISALVGARMFGLLGVILAAPAYAVLTLIVRYAVRKIFDEDPWEGMMYYQKPREPKVLRALRKFATRFWRWTEKPRHVIRDWAKAGWAKIIAFFKKQSLKKTRSQTAKKRAGKKASAAKPAPEEPREDAQKPEN